MVRPFSTHFVYVDSYKDNNFLTLVSGFPSFLRPTLYLQTCLIIRCQSVTTLGGRTI